VGEVGTERPGSAPPDVEEVVSSSDGGQGRVHPDSGISRLPWSRGATVPGVEVRGDAVEITAQHYASAERQAGSERAGEERAASGDDAAGGAVHPHQGEILAPAGEVNTHKAALGFG
jgi:hypothetical protein